MANILIAGGSGAIGRQLVPILVRDGHRVVAMTRTPAGAALAPPPAHLDEVVAREKLGDLLTYVFNEQSGASNLKAKKALDWEPAIPSWRQGFEDLYATA